MYLSKRSEGFIFRNPDQQVLSKSSFNRINWNLSLKQKCAKGFYFDLSQGISLNFTEMDWGSVYTKQIFLLSLWMLGAAVTSICFKITEQSPK